jgi:hypothetical protein
MQHFNMLVLHTIKWRRRWRRKRQNMWLHPISIKRPEFGTFSHLYRDLLEDEEKFLGPFRRTCDWTGLDSTRLCWYVRTLRVRGQTKRDTLVLQVGGWGVGPALQHSQKKCCLAKKPWIDWKPEGRRKRGRPRRTWKGGIYTAMNERDLKMGEWNNRRQWNVDVGRRRQTF